MTRKQFTSQLLEHLSVRFETAVECGIICTGINNDSGRECLSFRKKEGIYTITLGLDSLFRLFQNEGSDYYALSDKILTYYDAFTGAAERASGGDISQLKKHVYCRLVNFEMNRERLKKVPHDRYLDLAVIYYYRIGLSKEESACVIIDYGRFVRKENEDVIKAAAWENTIRDQPADFFTLSEAVGVPLAGDSPMYIISNKDRYFGSVVLFYPGFLKKIAEVLDSDFYILPSSIHECLILPSGVTEDSLGLQNMVRRINRTELEKEEILSDSVYYYSLKEDILRIEA